MTTFDRSPERFDPHLDVKEAAKPAPTSYKPKDKLCHRKLLAHVPGKAPRFEKGEYLTDAPGPGTYRVQSEFGIYCIGDTNNVINSDVLTKLAS